METSMERLSTGKRINSAKDDAAGVAIASRLSSEIRGTNQAIRNAQDGQALINTAEGAHKEIENILQRMRELAVQAANDTNDSTDRSNLQAEFTALTTEIDRIAGATTWAGQDLLTGAGGGSSDGTFNLQVGGNTGDVDKITVSISAMTTAALGASDTTVAASDAATAVLTGDFSDFDLTAVDADVTVTIDGVDLTVDAADATSLDDIVTSLNANTDNTDWTFSASGTDLIATAKTEGATVSTFTVTGGGTEDLTATTLGTAEVQEAATDGITFGDIDAAVTLTIGGETFTTTGTSFADVAALASDLQAVGVTGFTVSSGADKLILTATAPGVQAGNFTLGGGGAESTEVAAGAVTKATTGVDATGLTVTETTAGADAVTAAGAFDISTRDAALASIVLMDAAISTVNTQRAELGAVSNRLDNTVSNLTNISINLEGGRGRIEDADFAAESTSLAKSQILQQASTAMLAQANASKQSVLSLLQG
ncbi:flagellin [Yoonia vestfoldensis]